MGRRAQNVTVRDSSLSGWRESFCKGGKELFIKSEADVRNIHRETATLLKRELSTTVFL